MSTSPSSGDGVAEEAVPRRRDRGRVVDEVVAEFLGQEGGAVGVHLLEQEEVSNLTAMDHLQDLAKPIEKIDNEKAFEHYNNGIEEFQIALPSPKAQRGL